MTLAGLLTEAVTATEKAIIAAKSLMRSEKKQQQIQRTDNVRQYTMEGVEKKNEGKERK